MSDKDSATHDEPIGSRPSQGRLRSARRLLQRKQRSASGLFLAEGPQAVREALAHGEVTEVWYTIGNDRVVDLAQQARRQRIDLFGVSSAELGEISDTVTPQGIVAICRDPQTDLDALPDALELVVVCAQIRDPGNAGAVIRCADAFGADAVLFSADSVEVHNPKVVRASAGSVFHLPVISGVHLANTVQFLADKGLQVLAADGGGSADLDSMFDAGALARPTAWMMGNEAWGLPPEHAVLADEVVSVPLRGQAESLNLATAAAVCLHTTAFAQHRGHHLNDVV